MLRGLAVIAVFATLMGLTCLCGTIPCAEAARTVHASAASGLLGAKTGRLSLVIPVKHADRVPTP